MSRTSSKRKNDKSSNPSGQAAKLPEEVKKPVHLSDDIRVIFAEETNREDG